VIKTSEGHIRRPYGYYKGIENVFLGRPRFGNSSNASKKFKWKTSRQKLELTIVLDVFNASSNEIGSLHRPLHSFAPRDSSLVKLYWLYWYFIRASNTTGQGVNMCRTGTLMLRKRLSVLVHLWLHMRSSEVLVEY
jgi:hypothetical protein